VVSFVIDYRRKFTIGVKFKGTMYTNGICLANFGLLIDRTSSTYLKVMRLKALAFVIFFLSLISYCINFAS